MASKQQPHRGRLQVQGYDMVSERSRPWAKDQPHPADLSLTDLEALRKACNSSELALRHQAFERAHRFISAARRCGGASAPVSQKYCNPNLPAKDESARVDVVVITGLAFV